MENVTDALYMAGAILVFIIALTISISSFTTLRVGVEAIVGQTETVEMAKDVSGKYINYISSNNVIRQVGIETVVSSMYRAIKENYVIYIKLKNPLSSIQQKNYGITVSEAGNNLIGKDGTVYIAQGEQIIKVTIGIDTNQNVDEILGDTKVNLDGTTTGKSSFYELLNSGSRQFYEFLGEYQNKSEVTEENKTTFRIITYVEI